MSIFDGVSRPMRAAGLGLLAVAVVAAAVGGINLVSGGDTPENAASATSTADSTTRSPSPGAPDGSGEPKPGDESPAPPDESDSGDEESGGTADPGDESGDGADSGDRDGSDEQVSVGDVAVRVYNNSNIKGLASEASEALKAQGWNVVETGNYARGIVPASTVYFRPGTDEEELARTLARQFGMRVEPRFDGISDASPGIVVIVAKDYNNAADSK